MLTWLKRDLADNPARCTLAYFHRPLFSSGQNGNDATMRPIWNILYRAEADVVIAGHDHIYERFARQTPAGPRPGGALESSWWALVVRAMAKFGTSRPTARCATRTRTAC